MLISTTDSSSDDGAARVKETSVKTFSADVLSGSGEVPVLVDFYAAWSEPCKQLAPLLEQAVRAAKGGVQLVRLDIEAHPSIPGQLGVQTLPAVLAFFKGQPIDGLTGSVSTGEVKKFIDRVLDRCENPRVRRIKQALELAMTSLDDGDLERAEGMFQVVLHEDRSHLAALSGLSLVKVRQGELGTAEDLLTHLDGLMEPGQTDDQRAIQARAALKLAREVSGSHDDLDELEQQLNARPTDMDTRFKLAKALHQAGRSEPAVDHMIVILKDNLAWNDRSAHTLLLEWFTAWGPGDPQTLRGRRLLASIIFS